MLVATTRRAAGLFWLRQWEGGLTFLDMWRSWHTNTTGFSGSEQEALNILLAGGKPGQQGVPPFPEWWASYLLG